ncbi:HelD family protein [Clostridium taeniosporum]|uniref:ATP-dependent DNA helicase n=1 Tax=Clostridium taeniosporum TaxID=394958 RepID=A0A1D7XMN8_9CLOT|nr:UvrD-helicase domain-containing protein [Clostridium taeniosporum]AOR24615.1 ATP-dependent DNA helicase [Clostridium taeniosporum]
MNQNLDFFMEQNKLEEVEKILSDEILNYIQKRKDITNQILQSRKKFVEEFKDDEDKVIDYFDHENYVKEEAYKTIDKRLKEFTMLKESPYFGKVTFMEEENLPEELYIGRYGLTVEKTYEPVIVDWRAPISSLFYKGTLGKSSYTCPTGEVETDILSRRQIIIKKGELKGIFDSEVDVKDEILQMVLTENSSDKLKDIVMSIQSEQDEIIRSDKNKVIVVNGVAGSGKTTIALHRISYLLYNYRKQFGDKVLIFGPNDIFMDYIAQVLPSLGEEGIKQMTFENFAIREIGLKNRYVKSFSKYIEEAMSGNEEALKEYKYKSSKRFLDLLNKEIDKLNNNYFKIKPVTFNGEEIVGIKEIEDLFNIHYKYMPLFRRSEKIKRVLISKIKDKRDAEVYKINQEIKEKRASLSPDEFEMEKNNLHYLKKIKIREVIRNVINSRKELDSWINHKSIINIYKYITDTNELDYMDLSGILYLMVKLEGKKIKEEIRHIVIDEAQDYSILQFEVIKGLTGCKSYTIVGDSNQRLINNNEEPAMLNLQPLFNEEKIQVEVQEYRLNKSYRSTQEIMEYATKFLNDHRIVPLVRHGEAVIEEEVSLDEEFIETIISIIDDYEEEGLENIAIIFNGNKDLAKFAHLIKERINIQSFDREDILYKGGKVLIPAYLAKGLEFDGVIVIENHEIDPLVKYIMCTRALHRLSFIKKK